MTMNGFTEIPGPWMSIPWYLRLFLREKDVRRWVKVKFNDGVGYLACGDLSRWEYK
jgi:hypothetical protein